MPAGFARVPNWSSWENQGGGIAVADVNGNGQSNVIVFQIDNPAGANRGLYRGLRVHQAPSGRRS